MATDSNRAEIVRFWRTIEMFSPPSVPEVRQVDGVYQVKPGSPLPWQTGHPTQRMRLTDKQAWRYTVYCGIYSMEAVFDVLQSVFPPDPDSFDERPGGESSLAAFVVTEEGRPLLDSGILSSCAWATGRLTRPGPGTPGWLTGFELTEARFNAALDELMAASEIDDRAEELLELGHHVGKPLEIGDLVACRDRVSALLGLAGFPSAEIRIRAEIVSQDKAYRVDDHDFLNSLIADDLRSVAAKVEKGVYGQALATYLRPDELIDTTVRVDVQERLDVVLGAVAPAGVPLGRWPSKVEHPLALSQQLAVNTAMRTLGGTAAGAARGQRSAGDRQDHHAP